MPTGRAVRKLPDTTRTVALAIGVFGRPCENAASISKRSWPAASCAQSSATASVMRRPWLNLRRVTLGAQLLIHLRAKAVHQHELDAHGLQDRQVLGEPVQLARGDQLAGNRHHEGLATVGVDVRRDVRETTGTKVWGKTRLMRAHWAVARILHEAARATTCARSPIIRAS